MVDTVDFGFDRISATVSVKQQFANIVHWKGSLSARFLLITDAPTYKDYADNVLTIDRDNQLSDAFAPIARRVFETDHDFAIISCCVGWNQRAFRTTPTGPELLVSAPFVEEVILRMPNLKLIIATGAYGAELCLRNFNVKEMYMCAPHAPLTEYHSPHPSIMTRKNNDKIKETVVRRQRCVRYMYTPPVWRQSEFKAFVEGCLWQVPSLITPKLVTEPFDVRSPRLNLPDDHRYINYEDFKAIMHNSFAEVAEHKNRGAPTRHLPTSIMTNAYDDPYHLNPYANKYVTVFNMQYDAVRNHMFLYGSTPTGTPIHVTVTNLRFTFWIRPHVAFAITPEVWLNRKTNRPLLLDDLKRLETLIATKCKYAFRARSRTFDCEPFTLSVDSKVDMHDGAWARHSTEFIRCDVAHHAFVDDIVKALRKVVDDYKKEHKTLKQDLDLRGYFDERLDFYQIFRAERMFGEKYNVQMSQWHRFDNLEMDAPAPVSDTLYLPHATHLRGKIILPKMGNPITCLPPDDSISLEHNGMTSSDIPPDVRGAFDIEVSKFGKSWGTALDSPIICICVCVRRHDPRVTKFLPKSYIPVDGYEYYVFNLGTAEATTTDTELRGQEHLFQFAREDDMLRAYFYFYSLLKPRYYASHNGKYFDIPFVYTRAKMLNLPLPTLGYDKHMQTRIINSQFQSKAFGEKTVTSVEGEMGIDQIDTCELFMREKKLRSYQLGALAQMYVGMTKSDMPYSAIMGHWRSSDHTRRVLIDYCIRDAQLPDQLLTQGQWITGMLSLSRVSGGVSISAMNEKGMQEKVLGATLQVFRKNNLPYIIRTNQHWTKQFNNEITEKWEQKRLNRGEEKGKEEEDDAIVFTGEKDKDGVDIIANKRPRTNAAPASIKSFFEAMPMPEGARRPKVVVEEKLTQREKRARASIAMAKAKKERAGDQRTVDYQGAVVMDVQKGWFYKMPIGCLDFAALYPSIMMSLNMGSNTKVYADEMEERGFTPEDCYKVPDFQVRNPRTGKLVDIYFLKHDREGGVDQVIEQTLVGARNKTKREMAKHENEFMDDNVTPNPTYDKAKFDVLNHQQNSIKIAANSNYGIKGAEGILGDKDVAGAVTAYGRYAITLVRSMVENEYNGICRGGDTDSVFMEFSGLAEGNYEKRWAEACARTDNETRPAEFPGVPDGWYRISTVKELEKFADEELVARVNSMFRAPMKIEYEKAMCCFICIAKKRYIFIMCIRGKRPYICFKGIEVIRRDSLPFLTETMQEVFSVLMKMRGDDQSEEEYAAAIEEAKKQACEIIRRQARVLANGKVPIQKLILSKLRSREFYANDVQEHLTVVKKMEARGLNAPPVGSRVYYVYTHQAEGERAITKEGKKNSGELKGSLIADDPEYVIQNRVPINYLYYFEHKFKEPIVRIMRYFLFDEMTKAALKRKQDAYKLMTPDKRRQLPENYDLTTVTLKELSDETEHFLFDTSSKKSMEYKKLQSRYATLRDRIVSSAFIDTSNKSSIASFAKREGRRMERLKIRYETDSEIEILDKERVKHEELVVRYNEAMRTCRSCLKISDREPVDCTSTDCSKYFPRVTLEGDARRSSEQLLSLVEDIESLSLWTDGCDPI